MTRPSQSDIDQALQTVRDGTATQREIAEAADILAQSSHWADQIVARELRNGLWSTPASEHGDNFKRRRDMDARPLVMETDEFLAGALKFPDMEGRTSSRAAIAAMVIAFGLIVAVLVAPAWTAEMAGRDLPEHQSGELE